MNVEQPLGELSSPQARHYHVSDHKVNWARMIHTDRQTFFAVVRFQYRIAADPQNPDDQRSHVPLVPH